MVNKSGKTHVCPIDNRRFSTIKALRQHERTVHSARARQDRVATRSGSGRSRGRRDRNGRNQGLDIAPSRVRTVPGSTITLSGNDRIESQTIASGKSVFFSVDVTPGISPRLSSIAKAYQRIRYDSVVAVVTPQASAMTNGGYVSGFVMDPEDKALTAVELSSVMFSQTKKWYESARIVMPAKKDVLYTSSGSDPRLSVPASFWLISEGPPSADLTFIVTLEWRVTLSEPTVEHTRNLRGGR